MAGNEEEKAGTIFHGKKLFFYMSKMRRARLSITAGLHVSEMSQVLQADNSVIPNLYAVGLAAGDFWSNMYTTRFPGNALGHALTYGYLPGRELAGAEA